MEDTGLTFAQKKFVLKTFCKCENKAEVQRRFTSEFYRDAPTRVTISRILDNFENHGTIQWMRKGHSRQKRTSESLYGPGCVKAPTI